MLTTKGSVQNRAPSNVFPQSEHPRPSWTSYLLQVAIELWFETLWNCAANPATELDCAQQQALTAPDSPFTTAAAAWLADGAAQLSFHSARLVPCPVPAGFIQDAGAAQAQICGAADANCVSGGAFCAVDPDGDGPATGADAIMQRLRTDCVIAVRFRRCLRDRAARRRRRRRALHALLRDSPCCSPPRRPTLSIGPLVH